MTDRGGYSGLAILAAAITGAAVGAGVAYLTTSMTGKERRRQIGGYIDASKEKVEEYMTSGRDKVRAFPDAVRSAGSAAKEAFSDSMARA